MCVVNQFTVNMSICALFQHNVNDLFLYSEIMKKQLIHACYNRFQYFKRNFDNLFEVFCKGNIRNSYQTECPQCFTSERTVNNGTVYLPSFKSFARESKWGCRLLMTSLLMGRKTQPTNQPTEDIQIGFNLILFSYMKYVYNYLLASARKSKT